MKSFICTLFICATFFLLVRSSPARPKQPTELSPEAAACAKGEQCFLSADKCIVNDGEGGKREATPQERQKIIDWWKSSCLLPAFNQPGVVIF